jgi:hypothetical protein
LVVTEESNTDSNGFERKLWCVFQDDRMNVARGVGKEGRGGGKAYWVGSLP